MRATVAAATAAERFCVVIVVHGVCVVLCCVQSIGLAELGAVVRRGLPRRLSTRCAVSKWILIDDNVLPTCVVFFCEPFFLLSLVDESVLRDLRALLAEAKQKVPPFLMQLDEISSELLELGGTCVCVCVCVRVRACVHVRACVRVRVICEGCGADTKAVVCF